MALRDAHRGDVADLAIAIALNSNLRVLRATPHRYRAVDELPDSRASLVENIICDEFSVRGLGTGQSWL